MTDLHGLVLAGNVCCAATPWLRRIPQLSTGVGVVLLTVEDLASLAYCLRMTLCLASEDRGPRLGRSDQRGSFT